MTATSSALFFAELSEFSYRYFRCLRLREVSSPWGRSTYSTPHKMPIGAVIHYTADEDMERVVRTFLETARASNTSAHAVVSARKEPGAVGLDTDLPLVAALPTTVVLTRPWSSEAWHATWANGHTFGIENLNVGELRKNPAGQMCWWKPVSRNALQWTTAYRGTAVAAYGRYWSPYTMVQIRSNLEILRALQGVTRGALQPSWVLGHEHVQGRATPGGGGNDKRDPGPLYPLAEVRANLFQNVVLPSFAADVAYAVRVREAYAEDARLTVGAPGGASPWETFEALVRGGDARWDAAYQKCALRVLGYHVDQPMVGVFSQAEHVSVQVFQRLMGLVQDGEIGPMTTAALRMRLLDRGYVRFDAKPAV